MELRKSYFSIDSQFGEIFEGYTNGNTWNGHACPYFTFEQAKRFAESFNKQADLFSKYDEKTKGFKFWTDGYEDDPDIFLPQTEVVEGKETNLYAFGGSWTWSEVKNVKVFENDSHFGGDVLLSYTPAKSGDYIMIDMYVYNSPTSGWNWECRIPSDGLQSHEEILAELKDPSYQTEGSSTTF